MVPMWVILEAFVRFQFDLLSKETLILEICDLFLVKVRGPPSPQHMKDVKQGCLEAVAFNPYYLGLG
jgi:hypothetical protein